VRFPGDTIAATTQSQRLPVVQHSRIRERGLCAGAAEPTRAHHKFPYMPDTSFEPAIADVGRYPAFSEDDVHSPSSGTAGTLYPALKARVGLMLTFDRSRVTLAASATWLRAVCCVEPASTWEDALGVNAG
jgi:hypothetical protein